MTDDDKLIGEAKAGEVVFEAPPATSFEEAKSALHLSPKDRRICCSGGPSAAR